MKKQKDKRKMPARGRTEDELERSKKFTRGDFHGGAAPVGHTTCSFKGASEAGMMGRVRVTKVYGVLSDGTLGLEQHGNYVGRHRYCLSFAAVDKQEGLEYLKSLVYPPPCGSCGGQMPTTKPRNSKVGRCVSCTASSPAADETRLFGAETDKTCRTKICTSQGLRGNHGFCAQCRTPVARCEPFICAVPLFPMARLEYAGFREQSDEVQKHSALAAASKHALLGAVVRHAVWYGSGKEITCDPFNMREAVLITQKQLADMDHFIIGLFDAFHQQASRAAELEKIHGPQTELIVTALLLDHYRNAAPHVQLQPFQDCVDDVNTINQEHLEQFAKWHQQRALLPSTAGRIRDLGGTKVVHDIVWQNWHLAAGDGTCIKALSRSMATCKSCLSRVCRVSVPRLCASSGSPRSVIPETPPR